MSAILTDLGSIFTAVVGMVDDVATAITGEPLLLLFAIIPIVGIGVGLFKRLLNVN